MNSKFYTISLRAPTHAGILIPFDYAETFKHS